MTRAETDMQKCPHIGSAPAPARSATCESCGSGVNLRVCVECGHVGCCESQQAHNTAHYRTSGHPIIRSMPVTAASFTWCYECGRYL